MHFWPLFGGICWLGSSLSTLAKDQEANTKAIEANSAALNDMAAANSKAIEANSKALNDMVAANSNSTNDLATSFSDSLTAMEGRLSTRLYSLSTRLDSVSTRLDSVAMLSAASASGVLVLLALVVSGRGGARG